MFTFESEIPANSSNPTRRRRWLIPAAIAAGSAIAAQSLARRYRRDLRAAYARLAEVDRRIVTTPWGAVEYAEQGAGEPVLAVHGIFQGCDGGLLAARDLFHDRRVIAPSRFGYHGSSMPLGATPAAQADAFAALLDALEIDRVDVVGVSAGSTSVLQLALRHPERVRHLIVLSGNLPGGRTAVAAPAWARLLYGDVPMWLLRAAAPRSMARLTGVPRTYRLTPVEEQAVSETIDTIFPVASKIEGVRFDAYVSDADVNHCELESIAVPTLLVHAKDDPLASYDAAERAAARIPGARLFSLQSGGHLLVGQVDEVREGVARFLHEDRVAA